MANSRQISQTVRRAVLGVPYTPGAGAIRPFFVVGSGRSGTTLTRAILQAHPRVHIPPETYVLGAVIKDFSAYRRLPWSVLLRILLARFEFLKEEHSFGVSLRDLYNQLLDLPESERSLATILDAIYMHHARHFKPEASRWGDKTPANTVHLDRIRSVFRRGYFVHLVRDGRDVVSSYLEMGRYTSIDQAARRWTDAVTLAREFGKRRPAQYLEVRYEDLVTDPDVQVSRLCTFLELDPHPNMLEHHKHQRGLNDVESHTHLHNVRQPLMTSSIGKWKTRLSEADRNRVANLMGPLLSQLGYE